MLPKTRRSQEVLVYAVRAGETRCGSEAQRARYRAATVRERHGKTGNWLIHLGRVVAICGAITGSSHSFPFSSPRSGQTQSRSEQRFRPQINADERR